MSLTLRIDRLVIDAALMGGERASHARTAIERELAMQLTHANAADRARPPSAATGRPSMTPPARVHPHRRLGAQIATAIRCAVNPVVITQPGRKAR